MSAGDDSGHDEGAICVVTSVPARLDCLPWSRFHTLVVVALGITWILDGLEVTLAGAVSGALQASPALRLGDAQIGMAGSAYVAGAVLGALFFGRLADRLGRKRLFTATLLVYLVATAATAFSTSFEMFLLFRFFTGAGIGGEYAAINSAIQELIPARFRGQTDLVINGSFWIGAALGALGAVLLLRPGLLPEDWGWRLCFGVGAVLSLSILWLRRWIPESPRWLMTHGRLPEAEAIVARIERNAGQPVDPSGLPRLQLRVHGHDFGFVELARTLFHRYPRRAVLALVLMASQAFFYNAIFFTYALVLGRWFGVAADRIGLYLLPFAVGNFLGPLLLGRAFDSWGRRQMIALTYSLSGVLLAITAWLFAQGALSATEQTVAWSIVFFFASAAASSAYLTVSEVFPMETRALAIALFYATGTAVGGITGPLLFGQLIHTGDPANVAIGFFIGAGAMALGGVAEIFFGVRAEQQSLEN
ncbi:MAG: MFS transporter, partial [Panacagrimonas sp.]